MKSRKVSRSDIPQVADKIKSVTGGLSDVPHILLATHILKDEHNAGWLHCSVDASNEEVTAMLTQLFKQSESLRQIARIALDQAEAESSDVAKIAEMLSEKLGKEVDPKDIQAIGSVDLETGEGLDDLIDALEKTANEAEKQFPDADEILRQALSKDDQEGDKQE